jgi:hypothetical protein
VVVTKIVRQIDFARMRNKGGYEACFEAAGSSGINTSFSYPRLPLVELVLPKEEMVL